MVGFFLSESSDWAEVGVQEYLPGAVYFPAYAAEELGVNGVLSSLLFADTCPVSARAYLIDAVQCRAFLLFLGSLGNTAMVTGSWLTFVFLSVVFYAPCGAGDDTANGAAIYSLQVIYEGLLAHH